MVTDLDPNEEDAGVLWAEIHRLRASVQGPDGYATWQEAAVAERVRRVKAETSAELPKPYVLELDTPGADSEMKQLANLLEALVFAADRHRDQRRKDTKASPYINHPIDLAYLLATTGGVTDLDVLRAAVLHDTIEDTKTTEAELRAVFGDAVAGIVAEVTDDKSLPKARRKELQIEHAPHVSRGAALVKLADKICNLRDMAATPPSDWPLPRRVEYFEWARRVVDALPPVSEPLYAAFVEAYALRPQSEAVAEPADEAVLRASGP